MQAVFQGATDAQARFSANFEGKKAIIVKLPFQSTDPVIFVDREMFSHPAVNLIHTEILVG
jgi:hypothetical protein